MPLYENQRIYRCIHHVVCSLHTVNASTYFATCFLFFLFHSGMFNISLYILFPVGDILLPHFTHLNHACSINIHAFYSPIFAWYLRYKHTKYSNVMLPTVIISQCENPEGFEMKLVGVVFITKAEILHLNSWIG